MQAAAHDVHGRLHLDVATVMDVKCSFLCSSLLQVYCKSV